MIRPDDDKEPLQSVQEYKGNLDLTFGDEDKQQATNLLAKDSIKFHGLNFKLNDRINPQRINTDNPFTREHSDLISFLKTMHEKGIFTDNKQKGQIIYVEDQFFNQIQMRMTFKDLEIEDKLTILTNGQ